MRKLAVLAVAIIVLATIGASYQLSANLVKTSNVVKIGYIPLALSLPVFVAEENGYFGSEGVKYGLVEMESTDSILKALVNNEIDAAFEVSLAPVLAFEEKNPNSIKIFSVSSLTTDKPFDSILVKPNSDIRSLKGLEGKKLGIFPGETGRVLTVLFKNFLKYKNVDSDKITFVKLLPDGQLESLNSGSVDAVLTFEPTVTQIIEELGARRLYGSFLANQLNYNPQGAAIFTTEFLKDNPEYAKKIMNVFDEAVNYRRLNEAGTRKILAGALDIDTNVADNMVLFEMVKNSEVNKEAVQAYIILLYKTDLLGKKLDAYKLVYSGS